jgi:hypothetical protein
MIPAPGGYHSCATCGPDCATCRHRRPATLYMADLTGCLHPAGVGSRSRGDTWRPRSCPAPGGGCWSSGDTPGATLCQEVGAGAAGTRGAPGAALSWEVGAGAAGTRDAPELPYAGRRMLEPS